jgi:hypothetical protein
MLSRNGAYVALALADPDGPIVAVSPVDSFSSIADEAYFQEVRQSLRFAMGTTICSPKPGMWSWSSPSPSSTGTGSARSARGVV